MEEVAMFIIEDGVLYRRVREGVTAPFTEFIHRGDLMDRIHSEFGHLGYESLKSIFESRAWWPRMHIDLKKFIAACPNCQIQQRQRYSQEKEYPQLVTDPYIQPFQRWGIDLIGRLPKTPSGNRWIITAIDYATGWPLAKALPNADKQSIADFIFNEIYMQYGAPQEIFTDGGKNLWSGVVEEYLRKMQTHHRGTSPYHPRTNGRVERLNGIIGNMLGKYLLNKPTKLWDQYLDQALWACRVRTNTTTHQSPFYLVYGVHPHLLGDPNWALPSEGEVGEVTNTRASKLHLAPTEAARLQYERAFKHKKDQDGLVTPHQLDVGMWVLVRHENPQKFESKWFGPYQIMQKMLLGTYRLVTPDGKELAALVHGNRLIPAHISETDKLERLWASPRTKDILRKRNQGRIPELFLATPENTDLLEQYLFDADDGVPIPGGEEESTPFEPEPEPERMVVDTESVAPAETAFRTSNWVQPILDESQPFPTKFRISLKRAREQAALEEILQPLEEHTTRE
jgi:Integrase zinc binding domain